MKVLLTLLVLVFVPKEDSGSSNGSTIAWGFCPVPQKQNPLKLLQQPQQQQNRETVVVFAGKSEAGDQKPEAQSSITSSSTTSTTSTTITAQRGQGKEGRRFLLAKVLLPLAVSFQLVLGVSNVAPASAGLLDEYGSDPGKIVNKEVEPPKPTATAQQRQGEIEPTLKGSYYYPTAKKRYLPRIIKVSKQLVSVSETLSNSDWTTIQTDFLPTAENAILPLQLYVSSLDGQGLSMSTSFAKAMKADAKAYEAAYKRLQTAVKSQNKDTALLALTDMAEAMNDYRIQGRLNNDEDGELPSVDEMRRMAMRRPTMKVPQK